MNFEGELKDLVGKTLLIGFTYYNQQQEITDQKQFFGEIATADEFNGIFVNIGDDKPLLIPPDPTCILFAPRGSYTCLSSSRLVTNPDYLTSWLVTLPVSPAEAIDMDFNFDPLFNYQVPKEWKLDYRHDAIYCKELIESHSHRFIGRDVIIGLTSFEVCGDEVKFVEKKQLYGIINRINYKEGIVVKLGGDDEYAIPPDLTMLQSAAPGEYRLRSTGKVVVDPAFVTMYESFKEISE